MRHEEAGRGGSLAAALLGLVAGAGLQLGQGELWGVGAYVGLASVGLALFSLSRLRERAGVRVFLSSVLIFLSLTLISFSLTALRATHFASNALSPSLEGRDISVTGVVGAMPQRSDVGLRFRFDVEKATVDNATVMLPPRILLGWYGGAVAAAADGLDASRTPPDLRAGERWQLTVRLKAPHGNLNPHGFDYELWLWEQGLQATGYVRAGAKDVQPRRIGDTWQHPVERARQRVRDAVFEQVPDRKVAGIIAALVAGDQNAIDRADWDVFRATGVAHLMSISGLHVTMFAWAAALLAGALWRRSSRLCLAWPAQHAALVGGVLLATAYALFSGWGVPSQRTVWMLATVGLLRLSARRWPWPHVWLLACAVVVAVDPWALLQPGFWLSFVAVGVLFAADPGARTGGEGDGRLARVLARCRTAIHEQWVVTMALTPLTLLLFGQVSVVGLLANAIAIPWVTLVVTPLAMAGVLLTPSWTAAGWAVEMLAVYLQFLAGFPFASVSMPAPPLWAGAAGVLGGLLLAMRLPWSMRVLGIPLLLPVLLWQGVRPLPGQFELVAADIGQGNALVVRTTTHTLVYDTGPRYSLESDAGQRVLVPFLRALDEKVDVVMLSHRDSDHTGGAVAVLNMQPQALLRSSIEDTHELQAVRKSERCVAGQRWQWDGIDFLVMQPFAGDYDSGAKSNAMSCVLRVSNGTRTALLVGDLEQPQEARLVRDAAPLRADVLLVPHHGSKTSSSEAFLDAVKPSIALVQAGYRNRFGHPAPPVLQRYLDRKIRVIDSPHCGAATWQSASPTQVECEREAQRRYWHHALPG